MKVLNVKLPFSLKHVQLLLELLLLSELLEQQLLLLLPFLLPLSSYSSKHEQDFLFRQTLGVLRFEARFPIFPLGFFRGCSSPVASLAPS